MGTNAFMYTNVLHYLYRVVYFRLYECLYIQCVYANKIIRIHHKWHIIIAWIRANIKWNCSIWKWTNQIDTELVTESSLILLKYNSMGNLILNSFIFMDRYIFSIPDKENVHANLILLTNFYSCGRKFPKVHKNHIVVNRYLINVLNCVRFLT